MIDNLNQIADCFIRDVIFEPTSSTNNDFKNYIIEPTQGSSDGYDCLESNSTTLEIEDVKDVEDFEDLEFKNFIRSLFSDQELQQQPNLYNVSLQDMRDNSMLEDDDLLKDFVSSAMSVQESQRPVYISSKKPSFKEFCVSDVYAGHILPLDSIQFYDYIQLVNRLVAIIAYKTHDYQIQINTSQVFKYFDYYLVYC
jgi:hypothetical protein